MGKDYFKRKSVNALPTFRKELQVDDSMNQEEKQRRLDIRTDMLANILAAYPTTSAKKLAEEYGLTPCAIHNLASEHGVTKAGRKSHSTDGQAVEKLDDKGNVVATYESTNKAAIAEGVNYHSLQRRLQGKEGGYLNGFRWRYKGGIKKTTRKRPSIFDDDPFDLSGWDENELY
jgi:hypothetical protein